MSRIVHWARALARLHGSPHGIAGGFALGLGLSLLPVPFVGMAAALALAPWLRLNLPATYLGTAVINPVSGPAVYFVELWLGAWLWDAPIPAWAELSDLGAAGWARLAWDALPLVFTGAALVAAAAIPVSFAVLWGLTQLWQRER